MQAWDASEGVTGDAVTTDIATMITAIRMKALRHVVDTDLAPPPRTAAAQKRHQTCPTGERTASSPPQSIDSAGKFAAK